MVKNLYEKSKTQQKWQHIKQVHAGICLFFPSIFLSCQITKLYSWCPKALQQNSRRSLQYFRSLCSSCALHRKHKCFKCNSFGSAYARVKPYILHVSGCFTLLQVSSTVLFTILTQLRGNIFNNHESQKMLNWKNKKDQNSKCSVDFAQKPGDPCKVQICHMLIIIQSVLPSDSTHVLSLWHTDNLYLSVFRHNVIHSVQFISDAFILLWCGL